MTNHVIDSRSLDFLLQILARTHKYKILSKAVLLHMQTHTHNCGHTWTARPTHNMDKRVQKFS